MLKPVTRNRARMVRNILAVWRDSTPLDRQQGLCWYKEANTEARRIADAYGLTVENVSTVISILSPLNKWERNITEAETLISAYLAGESIESVSVSTYGPNKTKAWAYLAGRVAVPFGVHAPKTKAFASLIASPKASEVVIDGHATNIALGERRTVADAPRLTPKRYKAISDAYVLAAKTLNVQPHQVQAVTWIAWR